MTGIQTSGLNLKVRSSRRLKHPDFYALVPKLFVKAEPGGILAGGKVLDFARSLPAQTEVTVAGVHYVQEDSPDEIGRAVADWMGRLG